MNANVRFPVKVVGPAGSNAAALVLMAGLVATASGQMPPMAAPAAPRAGDALLTCAQIAREIGEILKKKNLGKTAADANKATCAAKRTNINAASVGAMMAQAGPMMSLMNDPRLMRLTMLADEKQCAMDPPAESTGAQEPDPCGDNPAATSREAISVDPFQAPRSARTPAAGSGGTDPFGSAPAPIKHAPPAKAPRK